MIGFVFQYLLIRRRQSIGSFSIKVCGTLLLSNILKISFFIYRSFSEALLFQALLMILVQVLLPRYSSFCSSCASKSFKTKVFSNLRSRRQSPTNKGRGCGSSPSGNGRTYPTTVILQSYEVLTIVLVALASFSLAYFISQFQLEVVG